MSATHSPSSIRLRAGWVLLLLAACDCNMNLGATSDAGTPPRPSFDACGNGIDDDADGRVDEDCFCGGGESQECFPTGMLGLCGPGAQACAIEGEAEWGRWGSCEDAPTPSDEVCGDGLDQDCDGSVDEGCPCMDGARIDCGGDLVVGVCRAGEQVCRSGTWGACEGAVFPRPELCGNGLDDDCDGRVDEPEVCDCRPAPELCGNGRDDDCDGVVDEPDACSSCTPTTEVCGNAMDDDCDARTDEGVTEVCGDGIDQDCDGADLACDGGLPSLDAGRPTGDASCHGSGCDVCSQPSAPTCLDHGVVAPVAADVFREGAVFFSRDGWVMRRLLSSGVENRVVSGSTGSWTVHEGHLYYDTTLHSLFRVPVTGGLPQLIFRTSRTIGGPLCQRRVRQAPLDISVPTGGEWILDRAQADSHPRS